MNKRILVAEDDPFLTKVVTVTLKEQGFEVDQAHDGNETLEMMSGKKYDLVLLDLIMPNMDGFEVLKELKDKKNKVPVLVFTNLSQQEDEDEVMKMGAKGYYVKSNLPLAKLTAIIQNELK